MDFGVGALGVVVRCKSKMFVGVQAQSLHKQFTMGDQNEQGRRRGTTQAPPAYWALPDRGHHREVDVLVLEPTEFDVLLGRGKQVQRHAGNLHFQGK